MENENKNNLFRILTIIAICLSAAAIFISSFTLGYTISKNNECKMPMHAGFNMGNMNGMNRFRNWDTKSKNYWDGLQKDDSKSRKTPFTSEKTEKMEELGPADK